MASEPKKDKTPKIRSIFDLDEDDNSPKTKVNKADQNKTGMELTAKPSKAKSHASKPQKAGKSKPGDLFETDDDRLFGEDDTRLREVEASVKPHKYGRNQGEGQSPQKKKKTYSRSRYNKLFKAERYTKKSVQRDREYGLFWYDWLWHILRPALCLLIAVLVMVGAFSYAWNKLYDNYIAPRDRSDATSYSFTIASGESVTKIGNHLEEEGFISSSTLFKYYIQFYGLTNKLQSGVYDLSKSMDLFQVATALSSGKASNERTIRILPGWTAEDIADYFVEIGAIDDRWEFLRLCSNARSGGRYAYQSYVDYSLALINAEENNNLALRTYPLEGYLAPDTYRVYLTADAPSLLRTLIKQSDVVYNALFVSEGADESGEYDGSEPTYGAKGVQLTSDGIYTMASVIQKEATSEEDMRRVSAVFYNRLASGMRLQSDPTATYLTDYSGTSLTNIQTQRLSPYNTYTNDGLPLGPICSPGRAALSAALNPDEEYLKDNYLFFCAGEPGSGELVFAKTYAEHQANVNKYRPLWEEYDRQHRGAANNDK